MPKVQDRPDQTRINFPVDRELNRRIDAHVPWGMKASLMRVLIEMAADALDRHGEAVLGLLLVKKMELRIKKGVGIDGPSG
jgi:hypothetical protein